MRAKDYGWEPCEEEPGCYGIVRAVFVQGAWVYAHVHQLPSGDWRWYLWGDGVPDKPGPTGTERTMAWAMTAAMAAQGVGA